MSEPFLTYYTKMNNMTNLLNEIETCRGQKNCFGKMIGRINPIVFRMNPNTMNIMVITEQPRGERLNKEILKSVFQKGRKNSIPLRLKELIGDEFYQSVECENGRFYWTHYIKCPGEFRKIKCNPDECADTHLLREIEYIVPSLIICIGGKCSSWILKRYKRSLSYNYNDWREHLWRQISEKEITKIKVGDSEAKVIFLVHPSERSGIGWFIDKKLKKYNPKNHRGSETIMIWYTYLGGLWHSVMLRTLPFGLLNRRICSSLMLVQISQGETSHIPGTLSEMLAPAPKWNNLKIIQTLIMKTKNIQGDEK